MQVICEEVADSTGGVDIDLQCREHVVSDTESETEIASGDATHVISGGSSNSSSSNAEPALFPQQRFSSPSAIGQSSSEITHRPKAIKAK